MKPTFVLDCSVVARWLFEDEADVESAKLLERLRGESAGAPGLLLLELANVLLLAERKKRISRADVEQLLRFVDALPIVIDAEPLAGRRNEIIALARDHGLTSYDGAYLELAIRLAVPLATFDQKLNQAAQACGLRSLRQNR